MTSREDYLKSELARIKDELYLIQQSKIEEKSKNFCPGYFKYLNSNSDDSSWWLYIHTIGMISDGTIFTHTFQKCSDGSINFELVYYYEDFIFSNCIPSSEKEFERERQLLLGEFQSFK